MTVSEVSTIPPQDPLDGVSYRSRGESTPRHHKPPSNPSQMRKIESQMIAAVNNSVNWKSANTRVEFIEENNTSKVYLHDNHIATVGDDFMEIFDGGWQSVTTKSRLNSLINAFCNGLTDGIFQKDFQWYIRDNNVTKDFTNGYIFA